MSLLLKPQSFGTVQYRGLDLNQRVTYYPFYEISARGDTAAYQASSAASSS